MRAETPSEIPFNESASNADSSSILDGVDDVPLSETEQADIQISDAAPSAICEPDPPEFPVEVEEVCFSPSKLEEFSIYDNHPDSLFTPTMGGVLNQFRI